MSRITTHNLHAQKWIYNNQKGELPPQGLTCKKDSYTSSTKPKKKKGIFARLKSFGKKLFTSAFNGIRNIAKAIKPIAPIALLGSIFFPPALLITIPVFIDWAADKISKIRLKDDLEKVKSRNGAKTEKDIEKYHKSLLHTEDNNDPCRILRADFTKSDKPKPLVVLFLGNGQDHNWVGGCGVNELYDDLSKREDIDVLCFRVGNATDELKYKYGISDNSCLHTDIVFEHSCNVIEDFVNGKGMFKGVQRPSKVFVAGYSWGGGSTNRLLNEKWNQIAPDIEVSGSAYIDAVKLGTNNMGMPVTSASPTAKKSISFHQNSSYLLNGYSKVGSEFSKQIRFTNNGVNEIDHNSIDDNSKVKNQIIQFIEKTTLSKP